MSESIVEYDALEIPDNIYPARGRKPASAIASLRSIDFSPIPDNIYPARGRKPHQHLLEQLPYCEYSRQYLPRKGTETSHCHLHEYLMDNLIPDNIYPARGRKHKESKADLVILSIQIPDNIYPARGRKLFWEKHKDD